MPGSITFLTNPRTNPKPRMKRRSSRKRSHSRRPTRARRRRYGRNPVGFAANPRKGRRRGRRRSGARRRSNRRYRRNPAFSLSRGGLFGGFREVVSRDTLHLAGGAVASAVAGHWLLGHAVKLTNEQRAKSGGGSGLPWYQNGWLRGAFKVGVAALLFIPARKVSPQAAKGVLVGGILSAAPDVLAEVSPGTHVAGVTCPAALGEAPPVDLAASPDRLIDMASAENVLANLSESSEAAPWS